MSKVGGKRNFGYGKQLAWAGKQALVDRYGCGHYATRAAHAERWARFAAFAKEHGVSDARRIDPAVIRAYANHLKFDVDRQRMKVAYAQNLLSTVNVVLETMRGDRAVRIAPSRCVGRRSRVRTDPPPINHKTLHEITDQLRAEHHARLATVAELARHLGLRFREASLFNAREALRQADQYSRINITEGTKGGRGKQADRWVPVPADSRAMLAAAAGLQADRRNLLPAGWDYVQWRNHAYAVWRRAAGPAGIRGFHVLRAAYACERYRQLTGCPAPVMAHGRRAASKAADREARTALAHELGHGRIDVVAEYIGGL